MKACTGHERLVAEIIDDLRDGSTNILLIPNSVNPQDVEYSMERGLVRESDLQDSCGLFLMDYQEQSPVLTLTETYRITWSDPYEPRTVQNLLKRDGLPDIVFIRGFSETSMEHKLLWLDSINDFNELSIRNRINCPVFVLVAFAADPCVARFRSRPGFKVRYWYNLGSQASAESYYQRMDRRWRLGEDVWKAAIFASLVEGEYHLAEYLGDAVLRSTSEILKRMGALAELFGWSPVDLKGQGVGKFINLQSYVPLERLDSDHELRRLWTLGLMNYSDEYGWEAPSWVLTSLGCKVALEHRIWRAQIRVVMPIINKLRLFVIEQLVEKHGTNWLQWDVPHREGAVVGKRIEKPFDAELLFLRDLLEYNEQTLRNEQALLPAIRQAHLLRNQLAHSATIEFLEYVELLEQVNNLTY